MKKILTFAILLITVIVLSGCSLTKNESLTGTNLFDKKENVIGFSALSSVMTLHDSVKDTKTEVSQLALLSTDVVEDTFTILSEITELTPYLDIISTFMGSGNQLDVDIQSTDYEGYEYQMVVSLLNMQGERTQYTMYYNETFENTVDEDDMDDMDEINSTLEGIMIIDGITYTLQGTREIEEGEESIEFIAKLDDENYVTLEYEMETDENESEIEFLYEVFENNQLTKSVEIKFEQDNEETEITLKFLKENHESEYDFEMEIDGDTRKIEIQYIIKENGQTVEEGKIEVSIVFDAQTGTNIVRYEIEIEGEKFVVDDEYDEEYDEEEYDEEDDDEEDDEEDMAYTTKYTL